MSVGPRNWLAGVGSKPDSTAAVKGHNLFCEEECEVRISKLGVSLMVMLAICAEPYISAQETRGGDEKAAQKNGDVQKAMEDAPKPYEKVVTSEAETKEGVFTVHQIKSKIYYEIPKKELDKDFLWVSRFAKISYLGQRRLEPVNTRLVRWNRHGNRVLLCSVSSDITADKRLPIARAVEAENNDTILMAFDIEAFGKDEAPVIEVSKLLTTEVPEFSARRNLRAQGFDGSRSFLERVTPYPQNIE